MPKIWSFFYIFKRIVYINHVEIHLAIPAIFMATVEWQIVAHSQEHGVTKLPLHSRRKYGANLHEYLSEYIHIVTHIYSDKKVQIKYWNLKILH